jgi:hypothetical protein
MYTQDMTLAEAYKIMRGLQLEHQVLVAAGKVIPEQLEWDIHDVQGRIFILTA